MSSPHFKPLSMLLMRRMLDPQDGHLSAEGRRQPRRRRCCPSVVQHREVARLIRRGDSMAVELAGIGGGAEAGARSSAISGEGSRLVAVLLAARVKILPVGEPLAQQPGGRARGSARVGRLEREGDSSRIGVAFLVSRPGPEPGTGDVAQVEGDEPPSRWSQPSRPMM